MMRYQFHTTLWSKNSTTQLLTLAEQETDAINIGYTVGGITGGFQDASTDNANMVQDVSDDTRTVSIKAAF